MEMSELPSPDPPSSEAGSSESFALKRQRPILKASDSSNSWDSSEPKLVQFRVADSESDVDSPTEQSTDLDMAPTENNTHIAKTRYSKRALDFSEQFSNDNSFESESYRVNMHHVLIILAHPL